MKKTIGLMVLIVLLMAAMMLLTACGGSKDTPAPDPGTKEEAKKFEIRIAHESQVAHPSHVALEEVFKKIVEEETDGRITVTIFPGSQMGNAQANLELVRRGDIEMTLNATQHYVQNIPEFAVWESFFLFDNLDHAHSVLDGKAGQELMKPLEKMGLVGLGYMEIGFRNFSNSKGPLYSVDDFKGLKIRGYNPLMMKAWNSVGVQTTSLTWAEVFTALQQGLIDGQECATVSFQNAKFYEPNPYWTLTGHVYTNFLWKANKKFMDGLSAADRELVERAAREAIKAERQMLQDQEEEILKELASLGVTINELPVEEKRKLGEIMNVAIAEDIIALCGQEVYDFVMAEVAAARK
ncbi:TRAP transporter substrate-binding protein [Desulfitibacter alkalitolerans]|uniref:TRAP transporter substrate-binding protein n=1 Tax=Desulfitibacter alkalitolerans TaxID=264641 RepID=UPI00054FEFDD|nr:TRAP transporter substrate-binding protein [Desulfitibacter alkalitolerans]